jgi:hypothetical protein
MFSKRIAMAEVANWCLNWENGFVICVVQPTTGQGDI